MGDSIVGTYIRDAAVRGAINPVTTEHCSNADRTMEVRLGTNYGSGKAILGSDRSERDDVGDL